MEETNKTTKRICLLMGWYMKQIANAAVKK